MLTPTTRCSLMKPCQYRGSTLLARPIRASTFARRSPELLPSKSILLPPLHFGDCPRRGRVLAHRTPLVLAHIIAGAPAPLALFLALHRALRRRMLGSHDPHPSDDSASGFQHASSSGPPQTPRARVPVFRSYSQRETREAPIAVPTIGRAVTQGSLKAPVPRKPLGSINNFHNYS
jgi:hypothetical protein